jgi:hypothetical protein
VGGVFDFFSIENKVRNLEPSLQRAVPVSSVQYISEEWFLPIFIEKGRTGGGTKLPFIWRLSGS